MAVRRVDAQHVDPRVPQRGAAGLPLLTYTNRGADPQAAEAILARMRMAGRFVHVLDGDKPAQAMVIVHQGQFFNPMPLENLLGRFQGDGRIGGYYVLGHDLAHALVEAFFKAQVPAGENSHQAAFRNHRQPSRRRAAAQPSGKEDQVRILQCLGDLRTVLFGGLLALVVAAYYWSSISRTILFWTAFILTRPLGAVVGREIHALSLAVHTPEEWAALPKSGAGSGR